MMVVMGGWVRTQPKRHTAVPACNTSQLRAVWYAQRPHVRGIGTCSLSWLASTAAPATFVTGCGWPTAHLYGLGAALAPLRLPSRPRACVHASSTVAQHTRQNITWVGCRRPSILPSIGSAAAEPEPLRPAPVAATQCTVLAVLADWHCFRGTGAVRTKRPASPRPRPPTQLRRAVAACPPAGDGRTMMEVEEVSELSVGGGRACVRRRVCVRGRAGTNASERTHSGELPVRVWFSGCARSPRGRWGLLWLRPPLAAGGRTLALKPPPPQMTAPELL